MFFCILVIVSASTAKDNVNVVLTITYVLKVTVLSSLTAFLCICLLNQLFRHIQTSNTTRFLITLSEHKAHFSSFIMSDKSIIICGGGKVLENDHFC